jgi:hypothetical protein
MQKVMGVLNTTVPTGRKSNLDAAGTADGQWIERTHDQRAVRASFAN